MQPDEIISILGLLPLDEGGWFRETYRSALTTRVSMKADEARSLLTVIYYFLTQDQPTSVLHRNRSDIVHFFLGGAPLHYLVVGTDWSVEHHVLGPDLLRGQTLQLVVPGGSWKATWIEEGPWGLLGEAVAPGFEYKDREVAGVGWLAKAPPMSRSTIERYLRPGMLPRES
jgi:uncharacterized protein